MLDIAAAQEVTMANILVRDLSPELEAHLHAYAMPRGLTLSQAALDILQKRFESEISDADSTAGVPVRHYLAETLKEALHTKDEAEEFIRSHE
jgi:hypothetical protein